MRCRISLILTMTKYMQAVVLNGTLLFYMGIGPH